MPLPSRRVFQHLKVVVLPGEAIGFQILRLAVEELLHVHIALAAVGVKGHRDEGAHIAALDALFAVEEGVRLPVPGPAAPRAGIALVAVPVVFVAAAGMLAGLDVGVVAVHAHAVPLVQGAGVGLLGLGLVVAGPHHQLAVDVHLADYLVVVAVADGAAMGRVAYGAGYGGDVGPAADVHLSALAAGALGALHAAADARRALCGYGGDGAAGDGHGALSGVARPARADARAALFIFTGFAVTVPPVMTILPSKSPSAPAPIPAPQ